jgi:hypothetical protein
MTVRTCSFSVGTVGTAGTRPFLRVRNVSPLQNGKWGHWGLHQRATRPGLFVPNVPVPGNGSGDKPEPRLYWAVPSVPSCPQQETNEGAQTVESKPGRITAATVRHGSRKVAMVNCPASAYTYQDWVPIVQARLSRRQRIWVHAPVLIHSELDCANETTRPMSWPGRTATA